MKRATGVAIAVLAAGVAGSVRAAAEATERVSPVVLASSFGWNATNATKCLQSAFDSGAAKVVIDRQAGDWIIEPVFLRSNQEVVVADGVVVRALKGAYKHPNHCLFSAKGVTNVVLRGKGKALLRMERDAYTKRSEYSFSEWRHTLSIMDSADIRVSDLAFSHSGGDGIYVGRGSVDIDIRRVDCSDHYRQGISVISARNLTIADSRFTATKGTPPQCGIDFEPNFASEELVNCLVENCYFDGNASSGILLQLMVFKDTTKPVSITIRNCRARGNNSNGIVMMVSGTSKRKPVKGSIRIENCQFIGNKERAMSINGLTRETASVMVKDTIFDARGGEWGGILINNDGLLDDAANLTFENCRIVVDGKQPLEFSGTRGVGVESIDGTLVVERRGVSTPFDFAAFAAENRPDPEVRCAFGEAFSNWDDLRPVEPDAVVKKATPKCRGKFTFLQYLPNEGDYTISFRSFVVGPRKLDCPVRMRDITGVELGAFSITAAVQSVTIQTNARNLRRFEIDTCGNAVSIASPYPGQGILADAPLGLFKEKCRLYFSMSAEAGKAIVSIAPQEPAGAKLLDGSGKMLATMPCQAKAETLTGEWTAGGVDALRKLEIWSIDIDAEEDVSLLVGGATPILSTERAAGLVVAQ